MGSLEADDCCSACDVPSSVSVETPPEAYGEVVSDTVQVFGRGAGEVEQLIQVGSYRRGILRVLRVECVNQPLVARLAAAVAAAGHAGAVTDLGSPLCGSRSLALA